MRISDWSSDVCSSDLPSATVGPVEAAWLSRFCVGEGGVDKMGVRHAVHELIGLHLAGTAALRHEAIARRALDFRKSGEIVLIAEPQQDRFPETTCGHEPNGSRPRVPGDWGPVEHPTIPPQQ